MDERAIPILGALIIQVAVGLTVFVTNPRRKPNQGFLLLSIGIAGWLACLYLGSTTTALTIVAWCMRGAFITAILILLSLNLLRLAVREPNASWRLLFYYSRYWLISAAGIIILCVGNFLLVGARFADGPGLAPQPIYGWGVYIYAVYFTTALVVLITQSFRDLNAASGSVRSELGYLLLGSISILILTLGAYQLLRFFVDPSKLFWFAPLRAALFSIIVAYGIATRKLMEVGLFFRRFMSYAVLTAYLLVLYGAVWWLVVQVTASLFYSTDHTFAHIAAALVCTFAMAPARGFSQSLADRLFVGGRGIDFRATVSKAAVILESVTTLPDLLRRFATTIGEAIGTDSVTIYLAQRKVFRKSYPSSSGTVDQFKEEEPLVQWLATHHEPLILEELHRVRATVTTFAIRRQLEAAGAAAAVGVLSREQLIGIMLLGPRLSGRIYGSTEQSALQVLCGQLAVAIENAVLFTEVQNARIYNEILLQNLTTGVIAADAAGRITVFNQEAAQIAGLNRNGGERTIADLPAPLRNIIQTTLGSGERQEDREVELGAVAGSTFARASS